MATHKSEPEDQEALFSSYPCALYYVQSPSTASHANSSSDCRHPSSADSALLSPLPTDVTARRSREVTLSRYSSSRGSNNSFLHDKKTGYDDLRSRDGILSSGRGRLRIVGVNDGEDGRRGGVWRFVHLDPSSSSYCCVAFQISWRLMLSLGIAVLVFFLVTKPPTPKVAFKMAHFRKFSLGEGLDNTGVVTKILSCNSSLDMEIDNNSKLFGLHIHSTTMEMAFGRLKFGTSQGQESYVRSSNFVALRLYVGAKGVPMYGAGRNMQDMLESGQGLPLLIRVKAKSTYHVVWNLVRVRYHHRGECLLILSGGYDEKRHTQLYNGSCLTTTSHV